MKRADLRKIRAAYARDGKLPATAEMKAWVIANLVSGLFWSGKKWTRDPTAAMLFPAERQAKWEIRDAQIADDGAARLASIKIDFERETVSITFTI